MYGTVADFLRDKIQDGSDLSIVSAYFTIYALQCVSNKLDKSTFRVDFSGNYLHHLLNNGII